MASIERRSAIREILPMRGIRTMGEHIETDFARFHRKRSIPLEVLEGETIDRGNGHIVVKLRPDPENPQDLSLIGMREPVILYKKED
jgi:hypothetical protein